MSELSSGSYGNMSDVAWAIVLSRENRSTLSALSLVSRRFLRLATNEDLFRVHALRTDPSLHAFLSRDHPRPWRRAYRRARALECASSVTFHEISVLRSSREQKHPMHLLWSCATTECAVFLDTDGCSLVGWPRRWRLSEVADTHSAHSLRSAILPLAAGVFGVLTVSQSRLILTVVCGKQGAVLARNHVHLDYALCTTWTSAVANSPWGLKAAGNGVVVCTTREILCINWRTGAILMRWSREEVGDVYAFFVRGERNDSLVGYRCVRNEYLIVRSIVDSSILGQFKVGPEESVVDLVLNEREGMLACRVVCAKKRIICVVSLRDQSECTPLFVAKVRVVLHSGANSVTSPATSELMIQQSSVLYVPDTSRRFPGPVTAIARRQGEDTFCTIRCSGGRFLGALLTSSGQTLVTCSDTQVQVYRLSSGQCTAAYLLPGLFDGLFLIGVPTHAVGLVTGSNVGVLHFSKFCGSMEYPRCSRPQEPSMCVPEVA